MFSYYLSQSYHLKGHTRKVVEVPLHALPMGETPSRVEAPELTHTVRQCASPLRPAN